MSVSTFDGSDILEHTMEWGHSVRFYQEDPRLEEDLASYVRQGLANGDTCVLVVTQKHSLAIRRRLSETGLDIDGLEKSGRIVILDAGNTLSQLAPGGTLDGTIFKKLIGQVLKDARGASPTGSVRVFGEMVGLLAEARKFDEAVRLEDLWADLLKSESFTLF